MPSDSQTSPRVPTPGLLVITGASHTGKTSVAKAVLRAVGTPAAFLGVDDILEHTFTGPPGDRWSQIPLAYELLRPQVRTLLTRNWFVVFESTFTYIPQSEAGQFHRKQLLQLLQSAKRCNAPSLVIQLATNEATVRDRVRRTGRLPQEIVEVTAQLHQAASLPPNSLRIVADTSSPAEIANQVLNALASSAIN